MWEFHYDVNESFKGLMQDLIDTKFGVIEYKSPDKIKVIINDIKSNTLMDEMTGVGSHSLKMTVSVQVEKQGKKDTRDFSYKVDVPIRRMDNNPNESFRKYIGTIVKIQLKSEKKPTRKSI